jgi:hypothetical protein
LVEENICKICKKWKCQLSLGIVLCGLIAGILSINESSGVNGGRMFGFLLTVFLYNFDSYCLDNDWLKIMMEQEQ